MTAIPNAKSASRHPLADGGRHKADGGEGMIYSGGAPGGAKKAKLCAPKREGVSTAPFCGAEETIIKPVDILLVEDSPTDVILAQEALEHAKVLNKLHVVSDGVEALDFLRRAAPFEDAIRPDLILLDLNLPRKDGREVLSEIKEDEDLKRIPVVVLTTSKAEEDILRAYGLHANCYVSKPVDFEQFAHVVRAIETFWFSIVLLPPAQ